MAPSGISRIVGETYGWALVHPPAVKPRPAANMNCKRASQLACGHLVCICEEIAHLSDTSNCSDNRAVTHAYIVQVHPRSSFHH